MNKPYLTRNKAAEYLNNQGIPYSPKTLQKLASLGGGPRYVLFGNKALYTKEDLDVWITEKLVEPGSAA
ncbi:MAG: helix-turn-helix domain-containing protein [Candidatus Thiodiazotropha taylori]|nr:helix-turn-helix domain-containing protein [Candidatus Thiodiazotropha taylori]MCW4325601.1 helix-turn-helix domain-containing protein [Candidatus Thiodiazotropha taylori]